MYALLKIGKLVYALLKIGKLWYDLLKIGKLVYALLKIKKEFCSIADQTAILFWDICYY